MRWALAGLALGACSFNVHYDPGDDAGPVDASAADGVLSGGVLILDVSYQDGVIPSFLGQNAPDPDTLAVVDAPWDPSGRHKALRVTIKQGQGVAGIFVQSPHLAMNTRYRIESAFYLAPGTMLPAGEMGAGVDIEANGFTPPVGFYDYSGVLHVNRMHADSLDGLTVGAMPLGRRVPVDIIYEPIDGPDGVTQVAVDGHLLFDDLGDNAYAAQGNDAFVSQKLDDYGGIVTAPLTIYFDDLRIYSF